MSINQILTVIAEILSAEENLNIAAQTELKFTQSV